MTRIDPPDWRAIVRDRVGHEGFRQEDLDDVIEEVAQHLEASYAELRARGQPPVEARAELEGHLESLLLVDAIQARSARTDSTPAVGLESDRAGLLSTFSFDLRHAARSLRRAPVLAAVIVGSLGIVIGANTAIFGVIEAGLLRRLPVPQADELVALEPVHERLPLWFDYRQFLQVRAVDGIADLEAFRIEGAAVRVGTDSLDAWVDMVSGGFFQLLGVPPLLGRTIAAHDEAAAAPVVVVSEDFWRRYLDADSSAIGRTITVGATVAPIIGVLPDEFTGVHFARKMSLAMPISLSVAFGPDFASLDVTLIGRRTSPDNDFARVEAAIRACCADPKRRFFPADVSERPRARPDNPPRTSNSWLADTDIAANLAVRDASHGLPWNTDYRERYGTVLFALAAGGLLLLIIACGNVATLLVARAAARSRDFAIRLAMGASRRRVALQLFGESLLLALGGSALGLLVARASTSALLRILPSADAQLADTLSWRPGLAVFVFTTAIAVTCTLLVGLWPARSASRADLLAPLAGSKASPGSARLPVLGLLVGTQIAFTLVLVVLGALFATTVRELTRSDGGYRSRELLLTRLTVTRAINDRDTSALLARYRSILHDVASLPGVEGAAFTFSAPVLQDALIQTAFDVRDDVSLKESPWVRVNYCSADYFRVSGIGLEAGRDFSSFDRTTSERIAIVSAAVARRYFPRGAVGESVRVPQGWVRIVGVARDARYDKLAGEPNLRTTDEEILYLPIEQVPHAGMLSGLTLVVRPQIDAATTAPSLRTRLADAASGLSIGSLTTVGELLDSRTVAERFLAGLMNTFASLGLLLATAGVFGTMLYQVAQRTHEIGVRVALGARPIDAVWLVLRRALIVATIGTAIGLCFTVGAAQVLRAQLYGVSPTDAGVLAMAASLLIGVAVLAALIPGIRAASVDPLTALRSD